MSPEVLVFDILAVLAVIAAAGVVIARNPVHSAVALMVTFVNLAGIFVMLRAEFLAAVQIIAYTGAIIVLILFVIMLVQQEDLPEFHSGQPLQRVFGFLIGLMLLGEVAAAVLTRTVVGRTGPWTEANVEAAGGNVQVLGQFLYSGYVLPVQAVAVVLLVGTIGALVLARPDEALDRPRAKSTATFSLGHPRGADGQFLEPVSLPAGATAGTARVSQPRGELRGGIIVVKDAESYTDMPAWEVEYSSTTGRKPRESGLRDERGTGIGTEGNQ